MIMYFTFLRLSVILFNGQNTEVCNVWNHVNDHIRAVLNSMIHSNYSFKKRKLMPPQWGENIAEYIGCFHFLPTLDHPDEQDTLLYASFYQDKNQKYAP